MHSFLCNSGYPFGTLLILNCYRYTKDHALYLLAGSLDGLQAPSNELTCVESISMFWY
jgi:hypothetical protein